jgi:hypothetical protein
MTTQKGLARVISRVGPAGTALPYNKQIPLARHLMKLALLGSTPQAIAFLQGAMRVGHKVEVAYDAGGSKATLRDAFPMVRFRDDWEDLLGDREIDALLVAH